jgi:formate hydrogenlyase subunit 3/multisubunit Na+/H+ antiporter MnhD subunit
VLRVSFDLLGSPPWWWGLIALGVGLGSAFYGVIFTAVQTDMKRLLAWSSIENIGIIFAGLGLSIVFNGFGMGALAALALIAALYHCLNHAFMKSLLFCGTGAVLHATGERNLGRLGGLMRRMPWVAWLTLIGALAIAGLPPLNGFVSEWLLLQAFLFAGDVPRAFVDMLLPVGAAIVALCTALAGYAMVKFYGVIFLGQPREPALADAQDAGFLECAGLVWLAAGCVALGVLPVQVIGMLNTVTRGLLGAALADPAAHWWLLAPAAARGASYGPLVFLVICALVIVLTLLAVRMLYHRRVRRAPPWDCGYARLDARMQDSAEGFGQPIRHIFQPFFLIKRELPSALDRRPRYSMEVSDRIWRYAYEPVGRLVRRVADLVSVLQQGRISTYLLYSFVTLLVLLGVVL